MLVYKNLEALGSTATTAETGTHQNDHQFCFVTRSSEPLTIELNGSPVPNSWREAGELRMACSRFSKVETLGIRGQ